LTHRSNISTDDPIVVIDSSEIREGKIDELKAALTKLVEFVEANEAEPLAYSIYIDEDGSRMTVMQIHPSSESMEFHMRLAGPIFREFTELVVLSRVDFYGTPSDAVLEQMHQKARLLGNAPVVVHELHAGFARFETAKPDEAARRGREKAVTRDRHPMSAS
jgi:quinol monooxygenase YgiN